MELYTKRKDYMIKALENELLLLKNKAKYIQENLDGTIDLRKKTKECVSNLLKDKNYEVIDGDADYKYLTKMTMDSVTKENVNRLFLEHENKIVELNIVKNTTTHEMWLNELEKLHVEYLKYKEDRQRPDTKILKKKIVVKPK